MEAGVVGAVVAYLVEEEARQELVQTLHQPMEETIVWDLLARLVTPKTVREIQVVGLWVDDSLAASVFFPSSSRGLNIPVVPRLPMTDSGVQLALIEREDT